MKNKIIVAIAICTLVATAAFAYSRGDIVKHSDSCGSCRANGPQAFICGKCGKGFTRVYTVSEGEVYDIIKYSHEGHQEYDECQHSMTAKMYK